MAGPSKKKQKREEKNDEETAFASAKYSEYCTITPMANAAFARFHHPFKLVDIHCATDSDKFADTFAEFCEKGLARKMVGELSDYADRLDERWRQVLERVATRTNMDIAEYLSEDKTV